MESVVFPLLVLFDDSLHNRWTALCEKGCNASQTAPLDFGPLLAGGKQVPCGRSLHVHFGATHGSALKLVSDEPVIISNDSAPLVISFAFVLSTGTSAAQIPLCSAVLPSHGACHAAVCLVIRRKTISEADSLYVPICSSSKAAVPRRAQHAHIRPESTSFGDWQQMFVSLATLGVLGSLDEVIFVSGTQVGDAVRLELWIDELWIAAARSPVPGDAPPSYGRSDINVVHRNWVQGVRLAGSANAGRSNRNPHFCEYMSSELAHAQHFGEDRPTCKMDGDHLTGRWMQTCDPRLIKRPDHFAYSRALPAVKGWYDYRMCYRQSATERLRTLQALSWSWRPFKCSLKPVSGESFDKWLGSRTVLFLGDSLTSQGYYSLIWLLGNVIYEQTDLLGYDPYEIKQGIHRNESNFDTCQSTAGNEGGSVSRARLLSGGTLIKVMRHGEIVSELRRASNAFWSSWVSRADFIIFNVGHHYHAIDPTFQKYEQLAYSGTRQLEKIMKPKAHLIFRTTNIGHHSCENATRPLHSRREAWQQLVGNDRIWDWQPTQQGKDAVDIFKDKYNWRGPPLFEVAWAEAAKRSKLLKDRFTMLNVSFLDARADGHVANSMRYSSSKGNYGSKWKTNFPRDCLHYCYPGPSDYWALSIFNLLLNNPRFNV